MTDTTDAFAALLDPEQSKDKLEKIFETQRITQDVDIEPRDLAVLKIGSMLHELIEKRNEDNRVLKETAEHFENFQKSNGYDEASKLKKKRRRKRATYIAGLIGTAAAAFAVYWFANAPPPKREVKPADVKEEVVAKAADVEAKVGELEAIIVGDPENAEDTGMVGKLNWLNKQDEDKTLLIVDTSDFLGLKLDAISKKAKNVEVPKSVDKARTDAEDIREERRKGKATEKNPFKK